MYHKRGISLFLTMFGEIHKWNWIYLVVLGEDSAREKQSIWVTIWIDDLMRIELHCTIASLLPSCCLSWPNRIMTVRLETGECIGINFYQGREIFERYSDYISSPSLHDFIYSLHWLKLWHHDKRPYKL